MAKFAHCAWGPEVTDDEALEMQLGRAPRTPWRVARRCRKGYPQVIASPSRLDCGTPFPTTYWLSCPWLVDKVSALESDGAITRWNERIAADEDLQDRMRAAAKAFEAARAAESGGEDACEGVSVAGQKDPLAVKCLHARVAVALMGIDDPVGNEVLDDIYGAIGANHRTYHKVPAEETLERRPQSNAPQPEGHEHSEKGVR